MGTKSGDDIMPVLEIVVGLGARGNTTAITDATFKGFSTTALRSAAEALGEGSEFTSLEPDASRNAIITRLRAHVDNSRGANQRAESNIVRAEEDAAASDADRTHPAEITPPPQRRTNPSGGLPNPQNGWHDSDTAFATCRLGKYRNKRREWLNAIAEEQPDFVPAFMEFCSKNGKEDWYINPSATRLEEPLREALEARASKVERASYAR